MLAGLAGLALASGCAFESGVGESTGASQGAISGGEPAPDDFAVVGLLNGHGACSGTLIAPNLVLTAHHCVAESPAGNVLCGKATFGPTWTNDMSVTTRDVIFAIWRDHVASIEVPPGANDVCGGDVAVLFLDQNVEPSEAWPIPPRIDQDPSPGEPYRAVGFGGTADDGSGAGMRRQRDGLAVGCVGESCVPIYGVQADEWMGETGICPGDSGGPALDDVGRVIGVTSRGGPNCSTPIYSGVVPWADWLKQMGAKAAQQGGYEPWPWVTGGSTMPLEPPEAGPEASVVAEAPALRVAGGCAVGEGRAAGAGAWLIAAAGALAVLRLHGRGGRVADRGVRRAREHGVENA